MVTGRVMELTRPPHNVAYVVLPARLFAALPPTVTSVDTGLGGGSRKSITFYRVKLTDMATNLAGWDPEDTRDRWLRAFDQQEVDGYETPDDVMLAPAPGEGVGWGLSRLT